MTEKTKKVKTVAKKEHKTKKTVVTKKNIEKEPVIETKNKTEIASKTVEKKEVKKEITNKEIEKNDKKESKTEKEVKKIFIKKEKKVNKNKSSEAKENQKIIEDKKKHPTFRGRFGKKNIRRKSNKKWQKWRKPRSIDLDRGLQHGFRPKIGYRSKKEIRDIHPSGYKEIRVENVKDLEKVNVKENAIRIGSTVGKRKRNEIIKNANKKGIWILN